MRYAITSLLILVSVHSVHAQTKTPVYVFTAKDPSGFVDDATKAREVLVIVLLNEMKKSKTLESVDTPEAAKVHIEVKDKATTEEHDSMAALGNHLIRQGGGIRSLQTPVSETKTITLHKATLHVGEYTTDVAGPAGDRKNGLLAAIERWVTSNGTQLQK